MKEEEQRLQKEIQQLLEKARQTGAAEDELHGPENSGDKLPDELRRREQRLEAIQAAKASLQAEQAVADGVDGSGRGASAGG